MNADVELLPLPDWMMDLAFSAERIRNYARACIAHATAAKDAEIEALRNRLEISEINERDCRQLSLEAEAQSELRAQALRHLRNHTSVNSRQIELIDAALAAIPGDSNNDP